MRLRLIASVRRTIDLQGHRGARALWPENTLEGFHEAARLGVSAIELDIAVTADDVPVVCHDTALNPDITRDAGGAWLERDDLRIRDLSLAEVQACDVGRIRPGTAYAARFPRQAGLDGARIPTLRQVLAALPAMRFTLELKLSPCDPGATATPAAMTALTLREIDRAGAAGRVTVQCFDWRPLHLLRASRPDLALSFLTEPATQSAIWWDLAEEELPQAVAAAAGQPRHPATWAPDHASLTEAQVAAAHALGLRVVAWTVNDAADMRRLLGWGVDGLITDDPALAHEVLRQAGIGVMG